MAYKPILFSTEMVAAILDGRKATTRRAVNEPLPPHSEDCDGQLMMCDKYGDWYNAAHFAPYQPDDVLWVREAFQVVYDTEWDFVSHDFVSTGDMISSFGEIRHTAAGFSTSECGGIRTPRMKYFVYRADGLKFSDTNFAREGLNWKPSIHMPREAASIFLRVTDVRCERLQDITEDDALREGVPSDEYYPINPVFCPVCKGEGFVDLVDGAALGRYDAECQHCGTPIKRFRNLWDGMAKKEKDRWKRWDKNPWVYVYSFERVDKPIRWKEYCA